MKSYLSIITIFLFLVSCSEKPPIFYEYNGVTITRIDKGNDIYFYYGKCIDTKANCRKSYIKATYRGFNSGVYALLVFNEDKTVEVMKDMGLFEEYGTNIYMSSDTNSIYTREWRKEAFMWGVPNAISISSHIGIEQKDNKQKTTDVKVTYPKKE